MEPATKPYGPFWNVLVILALSIGLLPLLVSIGCDRLLAIAPPTWPIKQLGMAIAVSAQEAAFFLLTWGVLRQEGYSLEAVGLRWHYRPWWDVLWGVGLGVACFAISSLGEYVSGLLFAVFLDENTIMQMLSQENTIAVNLILSQSRWLQFYLVSLVVFVVPVAEETFFRGYAYSIIKERWGTVTALFLSSLVFSAVHTYVIHFLSVFLLGLLLGLAYEWRKTLVTPIVAHGVMNLLVAMTIYYSHL